MLTLKYNYKGKKKYFKKEEKKAYWNSLDKPLYDLKRKINEWIEKKKKIILYVTYDQTKFLVENIEGFKRLNIIGFLPYKNKNDDFNNSKKFVFSFPELKNISKYLKKDVEILISSYEFVYDIEREIKRRFPSTNFFKFYTGYSRNIKFYSKLKKIIKQKNL